MMPPSNKHISDLPAENLGQILCRSGLTVIDRLQCEGVSRHWKWAVGEFAWTNLNKLDKEIVFEGATQRQKDQFTPEHLVSLLHHIGTSKNILVELDLGSFGKDFLRPSIPQIPKIAESIQHFQRLVKLDVGWCHLSLDHFLNFLPPTLRQLNGNWEGLTPPTLEKLSIKCPNLEEIPEKSFDKMDVGIANTFIEKFGRLKTLHLHHINNTQQNGSLTAIATLKELEFLELSHCDGFDERAAEAISSGCKRLRRIYLHHGQYTEAALFHLAELPNLTVLLILDLNGAFTDSVLKAIARRGQLKNLQAYKTALTDDSVVFLIDRCKSLVSLDLWDSKNITILTLEAVIAEVHRRHGNPPRSLPRDPLDNEVFYFNADGTGIDEGKSSGNPWLTLTFEFSCDKRDII